MSELFEYSDRLNSPIEAFYCSHDTMQLPVSAHWHYFIELIYMNSGSVHISCNENDYILKAGDFLLIPPQVIHTIYCEKNEEYKYCCVKFNTARIQLMEGYLPKLTLLFNDIMKIKNPPLVFKAEDLGDLDPGRMMNTIIDEVSSKKYGYHTFIYALLSSLILKIMRHWFESGVQMNADPITDTDNYSIENVVIYIDRHSHENINIAELAEMCNMSYSYFAKVFHRQYGQSCKQYIEFIRLSKAENLLLFTDYDLTAVANETGFADCSHLIRCFKKRYNATPKQYRLMHRKN